MYVDSSLRYGAWQKVDEEPPAPAVTPDGFEELDEGRLRRGWGVGASRAGPTHCNMPDLLQQASHAIPLRPSCQARHCLARALRSSLDTYAGSVVSCFGRPCLLQRCWHALMA